jgi:cobalt-zinc-cadmium efflux system outer membrane protein
MHGERFHIFRGASGVLRSTLFAASLGTALTVSAQDGDLLTEARAMEYALSRPVIQQAEEARLLAAESGVTESLTRPNPVVSLTHENVDVPAGNGSESTVMVSQTFNISGRRQLRQEAAETRRQASLLDSRSQRIAIVQEARRTFAEALYQQQLQEAHQAWLGRLDAAVAVVGHLAKAGEVSGYDRRRLEREAQAAKAKLRAIGAEGSRKRELLAGAIGQPGDGLGRLDGDMLPDAPPALETLLASTSQHPALASLEVQASAYERDRQIAERLKRPDITVGVGTKHVSEPGFSENGLMLALSVPIPVFDKGQAQEQKARAQMAALQAERTLKLSRAQAELRGLWSEVIQLRETALTFRDETLTASQELSRIAEASYRAGEGSLLELLDAYRTELDAQTMKLDLALRARLSRIELDALTGATQHE